MRPDKNSKNPYIALGIITLVGILVLSLIRCKSPTSPEGKGEADIIVTNDSGETVDIYMDGVFKFALKHKWSIEIDNVSLGEHEMEARELIMGRLIDSDTIDVQEKIDYTWTIGAPPSIKVTNNFGKSLTIYMDGNYQFSLADNESRWIMDVSYGDRFLRALDANGQEVASTTIKVDKNEDYYWTIEKIT